MKVIEVIISPGGQTRIETKGFSGSECRQASEFVEKALGQRRSEELTREFHQEVSEFQHQEESR